MITADASEYGFLPDRLDAMSRHFDGYVDRGNLAGMHTVVSRRGEVVYSHTAGFRDLEEQKPVEEDTIWRIYSMTKPLTSVLIMSLYEQGLLKLGDNLSKYIPAFADTRVFRSGNTRAYKEDFPTREITIRDLLTHTSGLSYGFLEHHPVDQMYTALDIGTVSPKGNLADSCDALAGLPLLFSPGEKWSYSVATDVLGRVIEVISGNTLDVVLAQRILAPLGMVDTGFFVPPEGLDRFSTCYLPTPDEQLVAFDHPSTSTYTKQPEFLSGGGGLVSTAGDYLRFCHMMLNGGELDGERILGRKTVEFMTRNHLPGGSDLAGMGQPVFSETIYESIGFGLGFAVVQDPSAAQVMSSVGEYSWGGLASTGFYVDPLEEVVAMQYTQLIPSTTYPIRAELRSFVNAALA